MDYFNNGEGGCGQVLRVLKEKYGPGSSVIYDGPLIFMVFSDKWESGHFFLAHQDCGIV